MNHTAAISQVTIGSLMCGPAKRVWVLDPARVSDLKGKETTTQAYDAAVSKGACVYGTRFHNIFFDNCHSHVALVLNELEYDGKRNWNQLRVFKEIWMKGRWVQSRQALVVFGPVVFLLLVVCGAVILVKVLS